LGVTPSAWDTYTAAQVQQLSLSSFTNGDGRVSNNVYYASPNFKYIDSRHAVQYLLDAANGVHAWFTAPSGTAGNNITFTQAMTLNADGELLIGTTSDAGAFKLQVAGDALITGGNALCLRGASSYISSPATDVINFATASTERARISAAGDVLFGTTTLPSAGSGGSAFRVDTQGRRNLYLSTQSTGNNGLVYFLNPNGEIGSITTNGSATSYNTSSDARLKENITDSEDAGNKIDTIQVRQFDWKADGAHQSYGMIAQELMTVAPEAVSGDPESDEMMGVDYSKLVPMLVKEVQSLRKRVAELEAK
jgi:hypothetical protein